jgi:radical SAM superfamily enzyme YgiQ (UPF0313 family)
VKDPELVELLGRAHCYEMFVGVESFNRKTLKTVNKHHNHPEQYGEIVRLCDEAGIRSHFSNIIGFPDDDEQEVQHHLDMLKSMRPKATSFYILTPIPGTEQYNDYRKSGLITAQNLDRFDTTCSVWSHPKLSPERLEDLLYQCYVNYYGFLLRTKGLSEEDKLMAVFSRYTAASRMHPMSGGVDRLRIDNVSDYISLRRQIYDIDLASLPDNLMLSSHDENLNRQANWRVKHPVENVST